MFIPRGSKWLGRRNGKPDILTVQDIWATGGGANYEPVSYELKAEGSEEVIPIDRDTMVDLIQKKLLVRQ